MTDETLLAEIQKADEVNIPVSIDLLKKYGIYDLYEKAVPHLLGGLLPALQATTPPGYFPFTRKTDAGLEIPTYDFVLRLFMLQSAREQYVFAAGHLLRGHLSQIPGRLSHRECRHCISLKIEARARRSVYVRRRQETSQRYSH
jgi:hypothetical protein